MSTTIYNCADPLVGQAPYKSRVSGRTEFFPIACSIAGARGR